VAADAGAMIIKGTHGSHANRAGSLWVRGSNVRVVKFDG